MAVSINIQHDIARLNRTLAAIAEETGKDGKRLVADATVQVTIGGNGIKGLYQEYREKSPAKGTLRSAPWGVGKTFNAFGERDSTGVSVAATNLARNLLRGAKSGYFRIGGKRIIPLTVAKTKGRRERLVNARQSRGGKFNRLPVATAAQARFLAKPAGAKLLNLRALSVYFELSQREASRGYLARQFVSGLPRRLDPEVGANVYAARRRDGKVIGSVTYSATQSGAMSHILGLVTPNSLNTAEINKRVLAAVIRDKEEYLSRKILQNFKKIR